MIRTRVELELPTALWGGDPRALLTNLGLHGQRLSAERWSVWPTDDTSFIECRDLADESEFANNFEPLRDVRKPAVTLDDPDTLARFAELEEQLIERMAGGSDLAAPFHSIQASISKTADNDQLITAVRDAYQYLERLKFESSGELAFPTPGVTLLSATDLLIRRARLPTILFRFDQDPDALKNISAISEDEGGRFSSSDAWYREVVGTIHYFGPLLGCLSPGFWCLPTGRPPCAILFSLGIDLNGLRQSPMELMQLLPGFGRDEPIPAVNITTAACRRAIHWWSFRLNQMFEYLSDPTTFSNQHGAYDPYEHQHWLLTFGQVFGLTTALQTTGRNYAVQRVIMNTLLDTYADRIRIRKRFDQLCTYETAKDIANKVRATMTPEAAAVLMPVADRAVESLRRVQDGFFIREQRGDSNVVVKIPGATRPEHREPHHAAALLLNVFRNATHGFGGINPNPADDRARVAERLLAHHTGDLPDDLVFLPYLYLLDMLSRPKEIRETITKRARARN